MIAGEGEAVVACSTDEVFAFVYDLERYRQADYKIGPVRWVRRDASGATVRFRSRMAGLPGPVVTQRIDETPGRLDVHTVAPRWMGRVVTFHGEFACTPAEGGTRVFHREALDFHAPFRWVLEPLLRRWLARDTPAEMRRMTTLLDGR